MEAYSEHCVAYGGGEKKIYYIAAGPKEGPLIVFLHGWPAIAKTWKHQLYVFASLGFRVVAPDMPGYGKSTSNKVITDYAQENIMPALLAVLADTGRDDAVWIAHDWGCGVLGTLVNTHPHLCRGAAFLAVPYSAVELGLEELLRSINRDIYPEADYPYGPWAYQVFYEQAFEKMTQWDDQYPEGFLKRFYAKGLPENILKPAKTAYVINDGGRLGGIPRPPPADEFPWDATTIDSSLLDDLSASMSNTGFFGANAYYMNHKANRQYNLTKSVNGGICDFPILFVEAKYDNVCGTSTSRLAEAQRKKCRNLTETSIDAGHWVQLERPQETNAAITRWLLQELPSYWPYYWSNPVAQIKS